MTIEYQDEATDRAGEPDTLRIRNKALRKGFTLIPNHVLRARSISRDSRLLYGILLSYAWQTDRCFPGYETLCADLGCGRNQLSRAIQELKREGYITVQRRGQGKTSIYTIEDGPEEIQKYQSDTSGSTAPIRQAVSIRYSNNNSDKKDSVEQDSGYISKRDISLSKFRKGIRQDTGKGQVDQPAPARTARGFAHSNPVLNEPSHPTERETGETLMFAAASVPQPLAPTRGTEKPVRAAKRSPVVEETSTDEPPALSGTSEPKTTQPVDRSAAASEVKRASAERALVLAYMRDYAAEFHDQATLKSSVTRALHLFQQAELPFEPEAWTARLYESHHLTRERSAAIGYQGKDTPRQHGANSLNKMPYFFEVLECVLGLHDHPVGQHPLPLSEAEFQRQQERGARGKVPSALQRPFAEQRAEASPALGEGAPATQVWVRLPMDYAAAELWQRVLAQLAEEVTRPIFETYLRGTQGERSEEGQLVVVASSAFVQEWLEHMLHQRIQQAVSSVSELPIEVTFASSEAPLPTQEPLSREAPRPALPVGQPQ